MCHATSRCYWANGCVSVQWIEHWYAGRASDEPQTVYQAQLTKMRCEPSLNVFCGGEKSRRHTTWLEYLFLRACILELICG